MNDCKELIERLRTDSLDSRKASISIMDLCMDAAAAIETLVGRLTASEAARADLALRLTMTQQERDDLVRLDTGKVPHHESLADCNCPVCGCGINWDGLNDPLEYAPDFCTECGQRFDWSEEEQQG